ncbi:hypothetical protein psal_cds_226 [Pandoravirus salinus]|uniref:Uncharacterized protein n=1 Tax=Pandoravirus salinus TaxID=1349410 RepID=S4W072_9VIRU|nr:hypothetical protein psal_cds_226 [Pandoravirus salinus]AGO83762.1 hypothetical protein psal_cds_226 [Pandoravirus salinus]
MAACAQDRWAAHGGSPACMPEPGAPCAALVRAAVARAFRRCVIARGDPELDSGEHHDPSRPSVECHYPKTTPPADRADRQSDAGAHPPRARWVCFPFAECAYASGLDRDVRAPPLAAAFVDDHRWQRVARRRLARGSALGWRAAAAVGAAIVPRLPLEPEAEVGPATPFALAPGIWLVACLCAARSATVFRARVALSFLPGDATERRHATEVECVAKVVNVRLSGDFARGWAGTRRTTGRGGHLVCAPAWSEPIALSRTYPTHFYGAGLFFCAADGDWYVCLVMPLYRSTLWALATGLTPEHAPGEHGAAWADMLLAALAQVVLHTLPRARRTHLAAHNDLKIDNVAYRRTTRRHVYVRLVDAPGAPLLAIPTHGRLFYLIDFGWSSVTVGARARRAMHVESAACEIAGGAGMRAWNAGTDPAQVAYSLASAVRRRLGCAPRACAYAHTGRTWWPLFDALGALMAVGDASQTGPPVVLPLASGRHDNNHDATHTNGSVGENNAAAGVDNRDRGSESAWDDLFYAGVSASCRMGRLGTFAALAAARFAIDERAHPLPAGRLVTTYALADIVARRGPVVTRPI